VVALLADGLTDRGHQVTLFAAPGSDTDARLVPSLAEVPPEELIDDPWYEASHIVSVYEHGDEFDLLHDHTGPVGASIGAMSDAPRSIPYEQFGVPSMPTQTRPTNPILHDAIPVGTDFIGGAKALPVRSTGPGQVAPGTDFAGGTLPLPADQDQGEPDNERAA
jgi:hypothetical protein